MAISFLKKSLSAAYNGYQNKITEPDTPDNESDDEEYQQMNDLDFLNYSKKSKSNEELDLNEKNFFRKNFTDKTFSKLKKDENFEKKNDNEDVYFNIFENFQKKNFSFKIQPNGPFSLLIPSMWPKELFRNEKDFIDENKFDFDLNSKSNFDINKYDQFGFLIDYNKNKIENLINLSLDENDNLNQKSNLSKKNLKQDFVFKQDEIEFKKNENDLKQKWLAYLEMTYNQIDQPKTKWSQVENKIKHSVTLDNLIKLGIPMHLRSNLWLRFSDGFLMKNKCKFTYAQLCNQSNHVHSLSDQQMLCVLPTNICFQNLDCIGIQRLKRILQVIKWLERSGTNLLFNNHESLSLAIIAANLLLILEEEDTFWLILSILNEWKLIFTNNFTNKLNDDKIKSLLQKHCSEIYEKLIKEKIDLNLITNYWFSSFFANNVIKLQVLFYLWDLYFYHGFIVMFQLTLGLILHEKDNLLHINDSANLFNELSNLPEKLLIDKSSLNSIWEIGYSKLDHLDDKFYSNQNYSDLQMEQLKIAIPAVQLFNENTPGIQLMKNSYSLNSITINNELKYKNVKQTTILMELHEAIVAIGKHFEANDPGFIGNFDVNFNLKKKINFSLHLNNYNLNVKNHFDKKNQINSNLNFVKSCKRARALIDFQKNDSDELGFRKNDIIKILDERDEHCWIGELNGICGWFPSKFVEILDEKFGTYNECGNDSVTPFINDLVRGRLCSVLKCILNYGLKKSIFFSMHPWILIENLKKNYMDSKNNISSKFILNKTFKLDELDLTLNVKELLFKSVIYINETHENEPMDVKLRSLICIALNHRLLHKWFAIYCNENESIINKNYHSSSFVNTPVWRMIKLELKLLKQFSFSLNPNAELVQELQSSFPISKAGVGDMLVKHHLFSWDI